MRIASCGEEEEEESVELAPGSAPWLRRTPPRPLTPNWGAPGSATPAQRRGQGWHPKPGGSHCPPSAPHGQVLVEGVEGPPHLCWHQPGPGMGWQEVGVHCCDGGVQIWGSGNALRGVGGTRSLRGGHHATGTPNQWGCGRWGHPKAAGGDHWGCPGAPRCSSHGGMARSGAAWQRCHSGLSPLLLVAPVSPGCPRCSQGARCDRCSPRSQSPH